MPDCPDIPDLTLLRKIGIGSYGDVWLARTVTGVYRAVKIVERARFPELRPYERELEGITQFQRLAGNRPRQLALMHVGVNEAEGFFYYVMELADDLRSGTDIDPDHYKPYTLKALRVEQKTLPPAECVRIGIELARSLSELHNSGLIHRDVKLSNVIFVAGVPKLADLGLVSSTEFTRTALGTPGYAPPEGTGTVSADVYGLGKVLYEISTGFAPGAFPRLPSDIGERPDTAALMELNEVILKACDRDPARRYESADEMLEHLLLLQAGKSIRELQRAKERLQVARRVAFVAIAISLVGAGVLGVQNHLNLRKLAATEASARLRAEADERLARYRADLHRAMLSLREQDVGLARTALRRHVPGPGEADIRGLEWYALWNEGMSDETRILGKIGDPPIRELALSPDGHFLAVQEGEARRTTTVWNIADGTSAVLAENTLGLGGFTESGNALIVGQTDRTAGIFEIDSGRRIAKLDTGGIVFSHSNDARAVLTVHQEGERVVIDVWDFRTKRKLATWKSEASFGPAVLAQTAISPDRQTLGVLIFHDGDPESPYEFQLWTLFPEPRLRARRTDFYHLDSIVFSPDSQRVAIAGPSTILSILDARDGRTLTTLPGHQGSAMDVAFSEDGARLASAGEDLTVRVWNLADGRPIDVLRGHESPVTEVLWRGPDELITASTDGTIRFWRPGQPRPPRAKAGFWTDFNGDLLYAPDGRHIVVTMGDGAIGEIDALTFEPTGRRWQAFHPLYVGTDQIHALSREMELVHADIETGEIRHTGLRVPSGDRVVMLAEAENGQVAVLGMRDGAVEFWDCQAGKRIARSDEHTTTIFGAAIAPDASIAATGDVSGAVRIWDPRRGRLLQRLDSSQSMVLCVAVSAAGHVAIGRADGTLTVVDGRSGETIAVRMAHSRGLNALAFSPDRTRLFTAGYDGLLTAWSVPDYREIVMLPVQTVDPAHESPDPRPALLKFAPDSSRLATFTEDGWLRRWELTIGGTTHLAGSDGTSVAAVDRGEGGR